MSTNIQHLIKFKFVSYISETRGVQKYLRAPYIQNRKIVNGPLARAADHHLVAKKRTRLSHQKEGGHARIGGPSH